MSSDRLVVINDPSAFEVMNALKYFQSFTKFIGLDIAVDSFFSGQLEKMSQQLYQAQ